MLTWLGAGRIFGTDTLCVCGGGDKGQGRAPTLNPKILSLNPHSLEP